MVGQAASLGAAIDRVQAVVAKLGAIRDRTDPQRLHDLVAARRALAEHLTELATIADAALPTGDEVRRRDFRALHSAARNALALHQTNWPAVKLKDTQASDEYRASAERVDTTFAALLARARQIAGAG